MHRRPALDSGPIFLGLDFVVYIHLLLIVQIITNILRTFESHEKSTFYNTTLSLYLTPSPNLSDPTPLSPLRHLLLALLPLPLPLFLQVPVLLRGTQALQLCLPLRLLLPVALQLALLRLLLLVHFPQLAALVLARRFDLAADLGSEVCIRDERVGQAEEVGEEGEGLGVRGRGGGGGEVQGEGEAFAGDGLVESVGG